MITVTETSINDESKKVFLLMEMLLSGLKKIEILEIIKTNPALKWNMGEAEIDQLTEKAKIEIIDIMDLDKETLLANLFAKYDFIYKKMINVKDYKGAITALDRISVLTGAAKKDS